jgi:hypothetical protein
MASFFRAIRSGDLARIVTARGSGHLALWACALSLASVTGWSAGCARGASDEDASPDKADGGASTLSGQSSATAGQCVECVTSANCGSGVCAQFQGDIFCAPGCKLNEGLGACPSGTTCTAESAFNGDQVSVCVPNDNACGGGNSGSATQPGSGTDPGSSAPPSCVPSGGGNCSGYAAPNTPASCSSCSSSSSSCQPNGCYGGWYCDLSTKSCHEAPSGCSGSGGGTTCPEDAGDPGSGTGPGSGSGSGGTPLSPTGTVTTTGGSVSSLLFAVIGDTRPPNVDDTSGYPTTIANTLYSDIAARSPQPSFVVSTGDYQFSSAPPTSGSSTSAAQIALYMQARAMFPGPWFPAMGNHECNGYTASNCGSGNTDGVTANYTNFLTTMLGPLGQTNPYYVININATDNSWTSKFVFIAANAWDSAQSSWLTSTLAVSTTYTFVVRHEATEANTAPGVTPSDSIISQYPLTLEINGHTHDYSKSGNKIVVGNGGAPLTGSGDYGYVIVQQRSDGAMIVDEYDYMTNTADSSFHFVLTATGTVTQ